ncbi:prophage endopeptidase tail family protein [Planococcus sp. YIM B11945]|uniref:prophage endopeptidase tail family protein n=1 Tax=Planococcus sp. YIM B11945 TaxID=3435410 RepID=UPI003D7D2BB9
MLLVRNMAGEEEYLADFKALSRNRKVNGEKTLSLTVFPTEKNEHAYPLVEEESIITFKDEEYVIKKFGGRSIGNKFLKQVEGIHKFFPDMIDLRQRKIHNGSMTFAAACQFVFENSGYTYAIIDSFDAKEFENFGGKNRLELLQILLDRFQAEMEIVGKQVRFKKKIGNDTDFQFRYGFNVKTFSRDVDTSNLSTYIKGYGKKKEETDVLSGIGIPYASRAGTYFTEPGLNVLATDKVGASFKFSFTGTGFDFEVILNFLGGVWEFSIDGSQTQRISTFKDVTREDKIVPVIRGLEHKLHNVVATFVGADTKNPYTKGKGAPAPIAYLKSGNIIKLYRELVGDEQYVAIAEYTSPNAEIYGIRDAGDFEDERFTSNATLLAEIKKLLQDTPEVSLTIDFVDLRAAGYPYTVPNEGDRVFIIYEPADDLEVETRLMEVNEEYDVNLNPIRTKTTLANYSKTFSGTMFGNVQKTLKGIINDDGIIKYNVLDEAVKLATEAIKSAQTELDFTNGITGRDKEDPNLLTRFTSRGIGVSSDGGNTFPEAITGHGVTTSLLTAGAIHTNNIAIIGDSLFFWDGSGFHSIDPNDLERFVKITGGFLDISKGAISITRPDGYVVMNNGLLQNDFSIQPPNPTFRNKDTVSEQGVYWSTTEVEPQNCESYSYSHKSRLLRIHAVIHDVGSGKGARIAVVDITTGETLAQATRYNLTHDEATANPVILTVDLGTPTGNFRSIYIRLNTTVGGTARGRIVRIWLEQ